MLICIGTYRVDIVSFFDVWRYDRNYTFMAEFCLSESKVAGK